MSKSNNKTCTKCNSQYPESRDFFYVNKRGTNGLSAICIDCSKAKSKKHYEDNKQDYKDYSKKYYEENKEECIRRQLRYQNSNKNLYNSIRQRRKAKKAELPHTLDNDGWNEILNNFNHSCAYCGIHKDKMEHAIHRDHVVPVSNNGGYTKENIVPACISCNSSKNNRDMEEWYRTQDSFNEKRLKKIIDITSKSSNTN